MSSASNPGVCGMVLIAVCLLPSASRSEPASEREIEKGELLYRIYCQNCHGEAGMGDGPMVEVLTVPPSDLTRLARQRDGTFPRAEVADIIDGREEISGHGRQGMPVWGIAFQERGLVGQQEAEVESRIRSLVAYLESIQTGSAAD